MAEQLLVEVEDGVARLTLNRPDRLNAFNEALHVALRTALTEVSEDAQVRAVVLTGAGRGFCAGQDLSDSDSVGGASEQVPDLGIALERLYNPLVRQIRAMPKPIVCAVNGVAAGAGANVALACDIVLAARSARFIQAFCKLGLVPDCGGTWTVTRLIGEARAKALMLTGDPVGAEQAAQWGMIWKVVDDNALASESMALARSLAAGPTYGLGLTKQAIQAASEQDLNAQLNLERDLQRKAGASPDFAEGVAAFNEKRSPSFTGRRGK